MPHTSQHGDQGKLQAPPRRPSLALVARDFDQRFAEVHAKLRALEVEPHPRDQLRYSADPTVVEAHSAGFTRAEQALTAARSPATKYAEYEQVHDDGDIVRLCIGTQLIRAKRARFVLVLIAVGFDDKKREILGAFRLSPTGDDDESRWVEHPGTALATVIARYGAEYEIEQGGRSLFEPIVDFERQRFVMHNRVELPEVTEALGFDYNPDALIAVMAMRLKVGGGVKLYFPIMLRTDDYRADVEAATP